MMKKIILLTVAIMAMTMSAQSVNDNAFIRLGGGVSALTHPRCNGYENWGHTIQGLATIQGGVWLTPALAVGLESTVGFENGSKVGAFTGKNILNYVDVLAITKLNLNNVIHGYKGVNDKVEFIPTVGIGWVHGFTHGIGGKTNHTNAIMTKYSLDFVWNVSDKVQFSLSPFLAFNLTGGLYQGNNQPRFDSRNSWYGLNVGVAYKFGSGNKKAPKVEQCYTTIVERVVDTVVVEKEKVVEVPAVKHVEVTFEHNKAELSNDAKKALDAFEKGENVSIIGSATIDGTVKRNNALAQERANAVAEYLNQKGVVAKECKGVGSEKNRRVVIVEKQ